ncbi:MAG: YraN family protein [Chloroflexota bacterium]
MNRDPNARGKAAEAFAVTYLRGQGYEIRETNVRFRGGEIDIVAEDGATLAFVEVRARRASVYGGAGESIGSLKRRRMYRAAEEYLSRHRADADRPSRIDVVAIQLDRDGRPTSVELIKNALDSG